VGGLESTTPAHPTPGQGCHGHDEGKEVKTEVIHDKKSGQDSTELDPRDTEHPTGTEQAAENAATDSPS